MNRRTLLALSAALPIAALPVAAQEDVNADVVQRYLNILSGQNWSDADELLSEDYAPLYPTSNTLPGRDAWKQRQASNTIWGMFEYLDFVPVSIASAGDYTHILVELRGHRFGGGEAVVPLVGVLTIKDGLITGGYGALDEDVLFDQL